jgi:hypothetical protein
MGGNDPTRSIARGLASPPLGRFTENSAGRIVSPLDSGRRGMDQLPFEFAGPFRRQSLPEGDSYATSTEQRTEWGLL